MQIKKYFVSSVSNYCGFFFQIWVFRREIPRYWNVEKGRGGMPKWYIFWRITPPTVFKIGTFCFADQLYNIRDVHIIWILIIDNLCLQYQLCTFFIYKMCHKRYPICPDTFYYSLQDKNCFVCYAVQLNIYIIQDVYFTCYLF